MRIALIGASGRSGSRIAAEALRRGHEVTGIGRSPEKITPHPHLTATAGDANDPAGLARLLAGHDTVIVAIAHVSVDPSVLIDGIKRSGVPRLVVGGGAGTLFVAPGIRWMDLPDFREGRPSPGSNATARFLDRLRQERELDWAYLQPSGLGANFAPGERTGKFRIGGNDRLVGPDGVSRISIEDYAFALLDELETPRHHRASFTAGY